MRKIYPACLSASCRQGILFLAALSPGVALSNSPTDFTSIEELQQQGKISIQVEGTGGYQMQCVQMIIQNFGSDSVHALVEPGRRLNSVNDGEQDILVVKAAKLSLAAGQTDTLKITGFCCESTKASPGKKSLFIIGALAPAAWLILTNLIDKFDFPPSAIQNAIWVLSDHHDIRSIPAFSNPQANQLRQTVADLLDINLPWYSFTYASDSSALFTGKKTHLFAEVPFNIPFQALISTLITDKSGNIMHQGYAGSFKAGDNVLPINVPIESWAATDYDLFIYEDFHTMNKKLSLSLKNDTAVCAICGQVHH